MSECMRTTRTKAVAAGLMAEAREREKGRGREIA